MKTNFFKESLNFRLFIYLLIILGYIFKRGFYSYVEVLVLFVALFVMVFSVVIPASVSSFRLKNVELLYIVLLVNIFFAFLLYGGLYQQNVNLVHLSRSFLLLDFIFAIILLFVRNANSLIAKISFIFLFSSALFERVLMILSSPAPRIDVFDILKYGAHYLLNGLNPYTSNYNQIYPHQTPDFYSYFPGMIILSLPFVKILDDPRYLIIFMELVAGFLLYLLVKNNKMYGRESSFFAKIISLIFLFNPMSLYILEQSYIDSVVVAGLGVFLFLWQFKNKNLAMFFLGLLMSTKQTVLFAPLFLIKMVGFSKIERWMYFLLGFILVVAPFALWSPNDFISDTIFVFVEYPTRYDALTVTAFFHNEFGVSFPRYLDFIVWVILLIIFMKVQDRKISSAFWYLSAWYLSFFLFNKYAFVEYYYLVTSLILFSIGALSRDKA